MSFEEDQDGSFTTYLAEGDRLFLYGEYEKALTLFTNALEIKPGDKTALVARSKCYLHIGDPESALKDADKCIKDDKKYHKGLYQRAEALYTMGKFEMGLVYFHRGHALRPELDQFRRGIQKCQEAIENSVGGPEVIDLDPTIKFPRETVDEKLRRKIKKRQTEEKVPVASEKAAKTLLGEFYVDREYLEQLSADDTFKEEGHESMIQLINTGIKYLDARTDFWRQQKPMYTRKRERAQHMIKPVASASISKTIEKGLQALNDNKLDIALNCAIEANEIIEGHLKERKSPLVLTLQAYVNSLYGKALLNMGCIEEAIEKHKIEIQAARQSGIIDIKDRAMDNLAEAYVRQKSYKNAIKIYYDRVKFTPKSNLELAWIKHNWGRCLFEQGKYDDAESKGEASLKAAQLADDKQWQLNALVLIAQSQAKNGNLVSAEQSFKRAFTLTKKVNDPIAKGVIETQLDRIKNMKREGSELKPVIDFEEQDARQSTNQPPILVSHQPPTPTLSNASSVRSFKFLDTTIDLDLEGHEVTMEVEKEPSETFSVKESEKQESKTSVVAPESKSSVKSSTTLKSAVSDSKSKSSVSRTSKTSTKVSATSVASVKSVTSETVKSMTSKTAKSVESAKSVTSVKSSVKSAAEIASVKSSKSATEKSVKSATSRSSANELPEANPESPEVPDIIEDYQGTEEVPETVSPKTGSPEALESPEQVQSVQSVTNSTKSAKSGLSVKSLVKSVTSFTFAKSAKSSASTKSVDASVKSAKSAKSMVSTKSATSVKSTKMATSVTSIKSGGKSATTLTSAKSAMSAKSAASAKSAGSVKSPVTSKSAVSAKSAKSAVSTKSAMSAKSAASAKSVPEYPSGPDLLKSETSISKKDLNSVHSLKSNRSTSKASVTSSVTSSQKSTSVRPVSRTTSRTSSSRTVPSRTSNVSQKQIEPEVDLEPEVAPIVSVENVLIQED